MIRRLSNQGEVLTHVQYLRKYWDEPWSQHWDDMVDIPEDILPDALEKLIYIYTIKEVPPRKHIIPHGVGKGTFMYMGEEGGYV